MKLTKQVDLPKPGPEQVIAAVPSPAIPFYDEFAWMGTWAGSAEETMEDVYLRGFHQLWTWDRKCILSEDLLPYVKLKPTVGGRVKCDVKYMIKIHLPQEPVSSKQKVP